MAEFNASGLDSFMLSLQQIAEIPEEVQDEMLNAGADVLVLAQREKVKAYGIYDLNNLETRHVADSISKGKPKTHKGMRVIYVSPKGNRKRGKTVTRNAEILFVNEFGKRAQKARPAIHDATEESADRVAQAEFRVWDQHLKEQNL